MSDPLEEARAHLVRHGVGLAADASDADVAAALARAADAADGPARREARRLLYRLRTRGVAVPEVPRPDPVRPADHAPIEAWVSGVDGRGDRLAWLVREQTGGGVVLVAADLNEPGGLRDLRVAEASRKDLRAMRDRIQRASGLRLVSADWRAVDALLLEGADRLGASPERRLDYRRVRPRITSAAPQPTRELVSARAPIPSGSERDALLAASAALLNEPELRSWWPRPEAAAAFVAALREVRESPIVLAPIQQEERVRAILAEAIVALYPPPSTARRLQATAFVLAETARVEAARQALAVAATLQEAPARAGELPLLQALVHQGLGAYLANAENEQTAERAGALVLTPDEVRRAGSPSRPPRARG